MIDNNITLSKRRKSRIDIKTIEDFKKASIREGYRLTEIKEENFIKEVSEKFNIDKKLADKLHRIIKEEEHVFRADNIKGFIDYIKKVVVFEEKHHKLCKKISRIKRLHIDREEYERKPSTQDEVSEVMRIIENLKYKISSRINDEEMKKIEFLESELNKQHIYAKDVELLKKMVSINNDKITEKYNVDTMIKTLSIDIPEKINIDYIKPVKGTVEYHQHLTDNIPRMDRLIRNIDRYIKVYENEDNDFIIDQSEALQDTINIAIATYDNKEFKAISGKNNVEGYCIAPIKGNEAFECHKVNKLGKLGIGYKRVNDSEKKIFEEINKHIKNKLLKDEGELILYSKWEPCPSCYYVISQFCEKYPKISVKVKYNKKYGE